MLLPRLSYLIVSSVNVDSVNVGAPDGELPLLTSAEAAARLRVKLETLYAYVSRGQIRRIRGSQGSLFDPLEVEQLAATRRRNPRQVLPRSGVLPATPLMVLDTDIALIEDGELYFRGRPAAELARDASYDTVAHWLWTNDFEPDTVFESSQQAVIMIARLGKQLPATTSAFERLQVATAVASSLDPLRADLSASAVIRLGGSLIASLTESLPELPGRTNPHNGLAERLWPKLTTRPADPPWLAVLNAALVSLVDHDLAVSTLAARAAASARAHPYAVVSAGLGALDSALHGRTSRAAYDLLSMVLAGQDLATALAQAVRIGPGVPGFGHRLYPAMDPRAKLILDLLRPLPEATDVLHVVDLVSDVVTKRTGVEANVDLALAALNHAAAMTPDAGELIFALARIGGWIAHALNEYQQPPLRLRPVGRYVGP